MKGLKYPVAFPRAFAMAWRALWDNLMLRLLDEFYDFSCGNGAGMFTSRRSPTCGEESIWGLSGPTAPIYPYTIGSVANGFYRPEGLAQIRGTIVGQWTRPALDLPYQTMLTGLSSRPELGLDPVASPVNQAMPWLDPLTNPWEAPDIAIPPNYRTIPNRVRNPNRSPSEQSEWGPEADLEAVVSRDVSVTVRPGTNPDPDAEPVATPGTEPSPSARARARPRTRSKYQYRIAVDGNPRPMSRAQAKPKRPGKKTKERKTRIERAYWAFLVTYGIYQESVQVVKAVYKALPAKLRYQLRMANGGESLNSAEKLMAVIRNYQQIDLNKAVFNIVVAQLADHLVGQMHRPIDSVIRQLAPQFGTRMLGRAIGRLAGEVGGDAVANWINGTP